MERVDNRKDPDLLNLQEQTMSCCGVLTLCVYFITLAMNLTNNFTFFIVSALRRNK